MWTGFFIENNLQEITECIDLVPIMWYCIGSEYRFTVEF